MIADDPRTAIARLGALVAAAQVIVPFTGAGISTECGIPDFRSPGGLWTIYQPIAFDAFKASAAMRAESGGGALPWRRSFPQLGRAAATAPLRASTGRGKIPAVITQNIDNLHQASGFAPVDVIELHGNTTYATCLDCATRYELAWIRERFEADGRAPDCPSCGGYVKTATISFGQAMPEPAMRRAEELTAAGDLFLAIGSSLVVWPAAGLPLLAKRNGARLVILNREPTDLDAIADLVVHADIGAALEAFIVS